MKPEKQKAILIFYPAYFLWLIIVIVLSPYPDILTVFLGILTVFYFYFLREKWDYLFFFSGILYAFLIMKVVLINWHINFVENTNSLFYPWLISWGISVLSFRKIFVILNRRKSIFVD